MTPLTTIAQGESSQAILPRRVIARTEEEWLALWAVHAGPATDPPPVDLTRITVAAAFAGEKPSAGYAIEIALADAAARDDPRRPVRLAVQERSPGPGMIAAAVVTSPFHIVAVPKPADVSWDAAGDGPPADGGPQRTSGLQPPSSTGLQPRTAAALAYLAGPFSGALILFAESTNQDVRFHAWQSVVGLGALGLAVMASYAIALFALFVSAAAMTLMLIVAFAIWGVLAIAWLVCLWKAWSGGRWKLPIAGGYAERLTARRG